MERGGAGEEGGGGVAIRVITPNKGDTRGICCFNRLSVCLPLMYDAQYCLPPSLFPSVPPPRHSHAPVCSHLSLRD